VSEAELGHLDIIDLEVDEDFRTIYDEFNGHIGVDNLDPGILIPPGNLNLDNYIKDVHVNTAAAINWNKIAHPAKFPADDTTVTNLNINNFALFGSVLFGSLHNGTRNDTFTLADGVETLAQEWAWTTRGGPFVCWGHAAISGFPNNTSVGGGYVGTLALKQLGTAGAADGTPLVSQTGSTMMADGVSGIFPPRHTLNVPIAFVGAMPAGAARIKLILTGTGSSCTIQHLCSQLTLVEWA